MKDCVTVYFREKYFLLISDDVQTIVQYLVEERVSKMY